MKSILLCLSALLTASLSSFALNFDFNAPGDFSGNFNLRSSSDKNIFEIDGEGLSGSRAIALPWAKQTRVIATTKEPVKTWTPGASVTLAGYFRAGIGTNTRSNRRALGFGISNFDAVEPKPATLNDPVHPFVPTAFAGIYVRDFDQEAGTIAADFFLNTSQPDNTRSITQSTYQLKSGEWYYLEVRFTDQNSLLKVELAIAHVTPSGELIQLLKKAELGYGKTETGLSYDQPIHGFFYSRDPDFSGVKYLDNFRAE